MDRHDSIVHQIFDALSEPSGADLLRFLTAHSVWTVHGVGGYAGEFVGIDEIYEYWRVLMSHTEGTLRYSVDQIQADDDRVMVEVMLDAQRNDERLHTSQVVELDISGGKVEHAWFVLSDPVGFDRFFAETDPHPIAESRRLRRTFNG